MEALTALSLAGNICQFVEFGAKILREGKQISISGTSLNVQHLSLVANDLNKLMLSLKQQFESCRDSIGNLKAEDQVRD
jgi:hypothetical protein